MLHSEFIPATESNSNHLLVMLHGLDDIGISLKYAADIKAYEQFQHDTLFRVLLHPLAHELGVIGFVHRHVGSPVGSRAAPQRRRGRRAF